MVILSGASLFRREAWHLSWQVVYATIVRLIVLPAIAVLVFRLFRLPSDVYSISVIVALMPGAVSAVIFARIYGGKPGFTASVALYSTLGAIATVPAALWILFG
jgi:hypothetical protein